MPLVLYGDFLYGDLKISDTGRLPTAWHMYLEEVRGRLVCCNENGLRLAVVPDNFTSIVGMDAESVIRPSPL